MLSNFKSKFAVDWAPFVGAKWTDAADRACRWRELQRLGDRVTAVPAGFRLHPTVARVIEARKQMAAGKQPVDWGMAEMLAYASLLSNGYDVRLSGQDSGRGTFAHRHAVLHDQDRERWDEGTYVPLQNISKDQGDFVVIDSLLSEEAVVGFEYGFATAEPNALVIWEAQFGDFVNGAQVVIDQFISSGETKWGRVCGLVMFLPHGYEGQGPEHSLRSSRALSATLRRAQHAGLRAEHRGADVPHAAPADVAAVPQAAHRHDAQIAAAQEGSVVAYPRVRERRLPDGDPRRRVARGEGSKAHRRLQR